MLASGRQYEGTGRIILFAGACALCGIIAQRLAPQRSPPPCLPCSRREVPPKPNPIDISADLPDFPQSYVLRFKLSNGARPTGLRGLRPRARRFLPAVGRRLPALAFCCRKVITCGRGRAIFNITRSLSQGPVYHLWMFGKDRPEEDPRNVAPLRVPSSYKLGTRNMKAKQIN